MRKGDQKQKNLVFYKSTSRKKILNQIKYEKDVIKVFNKIEKISPQSNALFQRAKYEKGIARSEIKRLKLLLVEKRRKR